MADYLYLIPLLPLIGFLINGLLLGRLPKPVIGLVACGSVGLSFLLSLVSFFELKALAPEARQIAQTLFSWISADLFNVNMGFLLDPLSAVMILVVTGVGFLIHVYSIGYMGHDKGYGRYFAYLNLFTFAMLTLVLADNFLLLFVGWEGVGLCSYLLIGFWYEKQSATDAGKKAFIVNRIGDFGFLLGMFIIFWQVGSLDFETGLCNRPRRNIHAEYLESVVGQVDHIRTGPTTHVKRAAWPHSTILNDGTQFRRGDAGVPRRLAKQIHEIPHQALHGDILPQVKLQTPSSWRLIFHVPGAFP